MNYSYPPPVGGPPQEYPPRRKFSFSRACAAARKFFRSFLPHSTSGGEGCIEEWGVPNPGRKPASIPSWDCSDNHTVRRPSTKPNKHSPTMNHSYPPPVGGPPPPPQERYPKDASPPQKYPLSLPRARPMPPFGGSFPPHSTSGDEGCIEKCLAVLCCCCCLDACD